MLLLTFSQGTQTLALESLRDELGELEDTVVGSHPRRAHVPVVGEAREAVVATEETDLVEGLAQAGIGPKITTLARVFIQEWEVDDVLTAGLGSESA